MKYTRTFQKDYCAARIQEIIDSCIDPKVKEGLTQALRVVNNSVEPKKITYHPIQGDVIMVWAAFRAIVVKTPTPEDERCLITPAHTHILYSDNDFEVISDPIQTQPA